MLFPMIYSGNSLNPTPIFKDLFDMIDEPIKQSSYVNGFKVDVSETDSEYKVEAELAGVDKKDISINIEDDILSITVQKNDDQNAQDTKNNYLVRERMVSAMSLQRKMKLQNINSEGVKAKMVNGVLEITIPKKEPTEKPTKQIEIE